MKSSGRILLRPEVDGVRRGLIAVHTIPCATRLLPIYQMLADCNPRILWSFTVPPDDYNSGVRRFLEDRGIETIKWSRLVDEVQGHFDITLAAAWGGLDKLRMPVVKLSHGALHEKATPRRAGAGAEMPRHRHGLSPERMIRDGRTVASRTVLSHDNDLAALDPVLRAQARVFGDPVVDQISAHLHQREHYRRQLDIPTGARLVVVTSTAGRSCLWLDRPELLYRLATELPAEGYRVLAVLHPHLRHVFGSQLDVALRTSFEAGLRVVPADQDWAVPLIAADWVIGDHGSVLHYATLTDATLLTAGFAHDEVAYGTARAALGGLVPSLTADRPLEEQLISAARSEVVARYASEKEHLSSRVGHFATDLRREVHSVLGVPEPVVPARLPGLTIPRLLSR
ncbi:hypothetical protein ACFWN2_25860 [Lentzea sp. NPDC058436]|uniref:hypothetical protein n=1 Tax=Lentzea sp. NPDC058436 TaxID=3346499 RepID=UPI003655A7A7